MSLRNRWSLLLTLIAATGFLLGATFVLAQDEIPPAEIVNDEGGPTRVIGTMNYTNLFLASGIAQPLIILEDQTGFVTRDKDYLFPLESQVMGQFTTDFFSPPVQYSLTLPQVPAGGYNDVDNDDQEDIGVQVFAVAFWSNTFGDPYLDQRDQGGGGWSTAYASTEIDPDPRAMYEVIGGMYIVYAPDDQQGFPSGFGEDGLLFTADDPIVRLPAGYTVVDLNTDPFTFSRPALAEIDLIEGETIALDDFSALPYTEAFDAMVNLFISDYVLTEFNNVDFPAIAEAIRPRVVEAEANGDAEAFALAVRDFIWEIPDGHLAVSSPVLDSLFAADTQGGIGLAIRDVVDDPANLPAFDDVRAGRTIAFYVVAGSPAAAAGIEVGNEILAINGVPIDDFVDAATAWSGPFSTPWTERLQKLRYATRFSVGENVEVTFINSDGEEVTADLVAVAERESFSVTSFFAGTTGLELPVEFEYLPDSGYLVIRVNSFSDNELLTAQLWERALRIAIDNALPGIIVDARINGGGNGFLALSLAGYFYQESFEFDYNGSRDPDGEIFIDTNRASRVFAAPENIRYDGPVAVLVGPACSSACEGFAEAIVGTGRGVAVGMYPSNGIYASQQAFLMPDGFYLQISVNISVSLDGDILIEGVGVQPSVRVPVTEETLFAEGDPVLDAAIAYLDSVAFPAAGVSDGGEIAAGSSVDGTIAVGERIRYVLTAEADDTLVISITNPDGQFDSYLRIYDADDNLIAENDDLQPGRNYNSRVDGLAVSAGDVLIIEVGTYADSGAGDFTLTVEIAK
ncbi:hypothetical protein FBR02_09360 [Anaerolineae bacterium CFX9]|jgi:C-terminal processing protease CtpA/Prc|nr:hypothetical protein [Anaerolineae bacterium CFX9]